MPVLLQSVCRFMDSERFGRSAGTIEDPTFWGTVELNGLHHDFWDLGNGKGRIELKSGAVRGDFRIQSDYGSLAAQGYVSTGPGNPGAVHFEFETLTFGNSRRKNSPGSE